jgi:tRNA(fMet)-specific endonuclease VapC
LRLGASSAVLPKVLAHPPGEVGLCSIVKAELSFGAFRSNNSRVNLTKVASLFGHLPSLPFDDAAAMMYGKIRAMLVTQGNSIGPNDLFIAAIALANNAILVTRNIQEFSRVSGLVIENWE